MAAKKLDEDAELLMARSSIERDCIRETSECFTSTPKVKHLGDSLSGVPKRPRYARLPEEVLRDSTISAAAKVVYAELAMAVWQGSVARIGNRLIGERLGMSQMAVSRAIRELEGAGHLSKASERGQRGIWVLHSKVFGQKQGKVRDVIVRPNGTKVMASVERTKVG